MKLKKVRISFVNMENPFLMKYFDSVHVISFIPPTDFHTSIIWNPRSNHGKASFGMDLHTNVFFILGAYIKQFPIIILSSV